VSKLFESVVAVDRASLVIERGELFTLLGPSGCGKTTTLRLVAGLERPDAGEIALRGRVVASGPRRVFVPPHKRNLGMVFQSYAIWPHMSVHANVAYPLELRGLSRSVVRERVARVLDMVGLAGVQARSATLLSGGQMQRLALCRALVYEPDLLLLDEPFSSLDAKLREQMRVELKVLQRRLGVTVLFVTHDQVEALSLSDRIAVMRGGRVEQVGAPRELYERPASAFVRDFLGQTVILRGRVLPPGAGRGVGVEIGGAIVTGRAAPGGALPTGAEAHVAIRPEDIAVGPDDGLPPKDNALPGVIDALLFVGDHYEARVALDGGHRIMLLLPRAREWREGQRVHLGLPLDAVSVWPA
jgi:ABC-type Fe3+/spermidine/putrescine transport system ATPase subunit